jgi:hypothetical protein
MCVLCVHVCVCVCMYVCVRMCACACVWTDLPDPLHKGAELLSGHDLTMHTHTHTHLDRRLDTHMGGAKGLGGWATTSQPNHPPINPID